MKKARKILSVAFPVLILAFLVVGFLVNLALAEPPLNAWMAGEIDFSEFKEQLTDVYKADIDNKNDYINVNGLYAKLTGRKQYNGVTVLNNGMLTHETVLEQDMSLYADGIVEFNDFLSEQGIAYTYIQCPNKTDVNDKLLPVGAVNYSNKNANQLFSLLNDGGVDVIDFRYNFASTPEQIEKYFYNTDHHWNTEAGFIAYTEIVEMLKEKFPDAEFDENALKSESWDKTVYEDWFLGSHGRRVGKYFGGLDDFVLYTPKFETDMSMSIPRNKIFYTGSFEDVVVRDEFLDRPEYFDESTYCAYIGADYQLINHVNYNAKNDLKVLIIKDSFALAPQAFLTTQVKYLDVIDPRYYKETDIAKYVVATEPDIVITMVHPSSLFASDISYSNTGADKAAVNATYTTEKELGIIESIDVVAAKDAAYKNCIITDYIGDEGSYVLKSNTKYTVSIGDAEILSGSCKGFAVALFDHSTDTVISSYWFDFANKTEDGCYEWSFITPEKADGRYKILVYAGLTGSTQGNSLRFSDISLSRFTK